MTKEITKAYILQEIQDRFKLRELAPEVFSLSEQVVPVYDISAHLKAWETKRITLSITSTGGKEVLTVPGNMRYYINGYSVVFMAAGAYTVAGVYFTRKKSSAYFIYLDLAAAQSVSYTMNLPKTLVLDSGDALRINIDGYTSTADLQVTTDLVAEEIR